MAEQEEPVRRRVALKVIKLGMDTKQVIARFEAERQALALMDHPNIAKVLDAGTTEAQVRSAGFQPAVSPISNRRVLGGSKPAGSADGPEVGSPAIQQAGSPATQQTESLRYEPLSAGRPYFVMELVRGIRITDYCDQNNLSTEERLKLFTQVCQAIQHAHQKGIIHRDIKPSNILVTVSEPGAPGCPKVIDFGIAKATSGQQLTDKTVFTAFEQFIGTPAYMSPEQATLTTLEVDTRTDIYALGVLLYELLTGQTPFDAKDLMAAGFDAMRRMIQEKEPVRPSTRLSTMLEGDLTTTARHRHTEAPKLIHQLRGDLDWIVMKALEKDRARRYETANGLAMDVQHYLADEPVVARPPSNLYRFQKLARRNKLAFAAAGAVAAALIIGLAASTWEYLKERRSRQRAVAETAKATATSDLLQELLSSADPDGPRGSDYTVRQLLDDFSAGLTNRLAGQPEVEATVRLTIGWTYSKLGVLSQAEPNLQRALDLRRSVLGPLNTNTLEAEHVLAHFLLLETRKLEEGGRLARESWQGRQRILGPEALDTLNSQGLYAVALRDGGHAREAESLQRQALQVLERVLGSNDVRTIVAYADLGQILEVRGAYPEAEQYMRKTLAGLERIGLADQRAGLFYVKELAVLRLKQGDPAEARKLLAEVLPRSRHRLGPDHRLTLYIQRVLLCALAEEGRLDEAEALGKETLSALRRTRADQEGHGTARTELFLGRVLVQEGKLDEAELLLQAALKFFREEEWSKPKPELAAQAANWLGAIQLARKDYAQAETNLLSGWEPFFAPAADMSPNDRRLAVGHILNLYQALGKPEQAAVWQKKLDALPKP
jgi:serine/threonine protein kinase